MTSAITIQVTDTGGLDTRLMFPGLNVSSILSALHGTTSGSVGFSTNGANYSWQFTGSDFAFGNPGTDLSGSFTSATFAKPVGAFQSVDIATISVSIDATAAATFSGVPMQSVQSLTPDSMLNQLASKSDVQLNIYGNIGNDKLYGSDYRDFLDGADGNDVLTGNGGADTFFFETAGKKTADHVTDFTHLEDTIEINAAALKGISSKHIATEFHDITKGGMKSEDANDRLLYDRDTGHLYYDKDGNKAHGEAPQVIATLDNHAHIDIRDLDIFG